jgi:2-polyprenyl-6-methoxyphenol hydroxylase-like FAD-dependent oxidoreductase
LAINKEVTMKPTTEGSRKSSNASTDTEVLIVGAGPVGLFLANECARRGLRWRLIEEHASQSVFSKALAIFPRTLEIFDTAGVVAPFLERSNRVTSVSVTTHGHQLAHMKFAPEESPYQFIAMVPQNVTESLLLDELRRKGGDVEYETAFVSAEQEGGAVNVTVNHEGEVARFTAAVVVGCDGARSKVRQTLNIPLEGGEYPDSFLLADIDVNCSLPADELQLCPSELGPVAIFPISAVRRRIVATVKKAEGDVPSLELVQRILDQRAPGSVKAVSLYWSSYFRIHHRHATQLRVGRMFIAGDAAHLHSPFGGQGMNTGLHDVWNLAWKLDLFLHGHGNEELLDSYSSERVPVIKSVVDTTDLMTKFLGTPNKLVQTLRNAVIPMVSRLTPFQHAFVERLSELGIAYRGSPIVEGPGKRYLDDSMRGGNGIRDRFLLLMDEHLEASVQEEAKQFSDSVSDVVEFRPSIESGVKLVRPDGYLAYASNASTQKAALAAIAEIRPLLERQTAPGRASNLLSGLREGS